LVDLIAKNVIDSRPVTIHQLFAKSNFYIPDYQRDFVWEEQNVRQLWDDLIEHCEMNTRDGSIVTDPSGYFLGAIVVLDLADRLGLEVVDGQQRLVALSCMAAALADAFASLSLSAESASARQAIVQRLRGDLGEFNDPRWSPTVSLFDQDLNWFFVSSILTPRSAEDRANYWDSDETAQQLLSLRSSPAKRLRAAIEYSGRRLTQYSKTDQTDEDSFRRLRNLNKAVFDLTVILQINASSHSTAYDLFESLNYRGVDLSQADLVKNEALKLAPDQQARDTVGEQWSDMRALMSAEDPLRVSELLHYHALSRYPDLTTQGTIEGYIKANRVLEDLKPMIRSMGAVDWVNALHDDSEAVDALTQGMPLGTPLEIQQMLEDIKTALGTKFSYVPLIAAFRTYEVTSDDFSTIVKLIMNFSFRFMTVLGSGVTEFARAMTKVAIMIRERSSVDEISRYMRQLAPDAAFVDRFKTMGFSDTKRSYFAVYYLEKNRLLGTMPLAHGHRQNLEHIMPKTPTKKHWPEAFQERDKDRQYYKEQIRRIGNLLPLPESTNKSIKNTSIGEKLGKYIETDLVSPKEVGTFLDNGEWTFKSINQRQEFLATKYAVKAWPLSIG
jgi:hypothetical protein